MNNIGCKVIVSGRVQGVGFRYYTSSEAVKCGLSGHAKNLINGDVEVLLYGSRTKVNKMLDWLNKGPSSAAVAHIEVSSIPYLDKQGFSCH